MPCIDAYHWKVSFYRKGELVDETEGWPGEDEWRYKVFKGNLEFIERYVPRKLGTEYMKTED